VAGIGALANAVAVDGVVVTGVVVTGVVTAGVTAATVVGVTGVVTAGVVVFEVAVDAAVVLVDDEASTVQLYDASGLDTSMPVPLST
jgi:hypothetical protein